MTEIADDRSWWADVEHLRPGAPGVDERVPAPEPSVRRGRITGRPLVDEPPALRRADTASFAEAMDLDGAFGAPARAAESREIVLCGTRRSPEPPSVEDPRYAREDDGSERPAVRGLGSPDRPTVRITGHPGSYAPISERRVLREIEGRRPRSAATRVGHRPDRIAGWVVLLGVLLVIIAATSSSSGVS